MFLLRQILPAAAMATMVAAGICGLILGFGREPGRFLPGPVAVGVAYAAGQFLITGWVSFPPADTTNWLPYFGVAAAILSGLGSLLKGSRWPSLFLFTLLSVSALKLLLKPKFQYAWSPLAGWTYVACLAAGLLLLALLLETLARGPTRAFEVWGFLLVVSGGTFTALLLSGSVLLGQFAAVLGSAIFGTLILAIRKGGLDRGIIPVFVLLEGALLVSGYFFAALPALSAILLAFAPLSALLPIRLPGRFLTPGLRTALVLLPVAAAVIVAYSSSPPLDY